MLCRRLTTTGDSIICVLFVLLGRKSGRGSCCFCGVCAAFCGGVWKILGSGVEGKGVGEDVTGDDDGDACEEIGVLGFCVDGKRVGVEEGVKAIDIFTFFRFLFLFPFHLMEFSGILIVVVYRAPSLFICMLCCGVEYGVPGVEGEGEVCCSLSI